MDIWGGLVRGRAIIVDDLGGVVSLLLLFRISEALETYENMHDILYIFRRIAITLVLVTSGS